MKFSDLGVLPGLVKGLAEEKITRPTTVQIQSAGVLAEGKDVFINSETGTGKTLAYLLPLLSKTNIEASALQTIIIAPTHELSVQVHNQIQKLIQHSDLVLRSQLLIGETPLKRQIEKLKKKPHVVVGSPGRILELIKARKLKVHTVRSIVLDEIDRLLVGETLETIRAIIKSTLKERQLIFVSATEQRDCLREADSLSANLVRIKAKSKPINSDIKHLYFIGEDRKKIDLLRKLISSIQPERALVFVHKNERVGVLTEKLEHHRLKVSQIHKECTKLERKKALDDFRSGKSRILISSDISSRGLDIKDVSHIFNLDIPTKSEDYVHRAGRTGRAGAEGFAISLATPQQVSLLRKHARKLNAEISEGYLRNGKVHFENKMKLL